MAKTPPITSVVSGFTSANTLNANFQALKAAFDNTISLDGSTPNAMQAELDLGDNNIINAGNIEADGLILNGVPVTVSNAAGAALENLSVFGADLIAEPDAAGVLDHIAIASDIQKVRDITATPAELNTLDGIVSTTSELNKLSGLTASTVELNYSDGVTSSIQAQLDSKYVASTQSTATWEAGTSTTESLISPAKLAAAVNDLSPQAPMVPIAAAKMATVNITNPTTYFRTGFASITRFGTGRYRFTFSTPRPSVDYTVSGLSQSTTSRTPATQNFSTTGFDVHVQVISSGGYTDQPFDIIVHALS